MVPMFSRIFGLGEDPVRSAELLERAHVVAVADLPVADVEQVLRLGTARRVLRARRGRAGEEQHAGEGAGEASRATTLLTPRC